MFLALHGILRALPYVRAAVSILLLHVLPPQATKQLHLLYRDHILRLESAMWSCCTRTPTLILVHNRMHALVEVYELRVTGNHRAGAIVKVGVLNGMHGTLPQYMSVRRDEYSILGHELQVTLDIPDPGWTLIRRRSSRAYQPQPVTLIAADLEAELTKALRKV